MLSLLTQLSFCTMTAHIWDQPYELKLNSIQYSILSLFDSTDSITLESLLKKISATERHVEFPLQVPFILRSNVNINQESCCYWNSELRKSFIDIKFKIHKVIAKLH